MNRSGEAAPGTPPASGRELFAAGFVTFSLLYETQPVLPLLAGTFGLSPAAASLSLSAATFALALGMVVAAPLSDVKGRVGVLRVAIVLAALLGLLVPFAPSFPVLVALRAVQGLALAGVPAVAMAYLAEEVEPKRAGAAMGLFIAGNAVGGMVGRLIVGLLSAHLGWQGGLWGLALLDLGLAVWFARNVPPSRRFRPRPFERGAILRGIVASGRDPVLLGLYAMGFLVMGSFVTVYNYLAFSLEGLPWRLSPSLVSWVFLLYTVGVFASPLAGRVSDRVGRPRVLMAGALLQLAGAIATLVAPLPLKLLGLAVFTFGFFTAHAVASTGVGHRGGAEKAAASAHYLLAYYTGSSAVGTLGGLVYARAGWSGVVALVSALLALAVVVAAALGRVARNAGRPDRPASPD
ncbi:MAG: MFS transporter [Holophagales bacterium]|jgi:YNFM family putative membrane transporter|nr:MFS transporter [Holophagales bacterium]